MSQAAEARKYLATARDLAQGAAKIILGFVDGPIEKKTKADKTPVTEADLASDRHILSGLQQAFPKHNILTEETGYEAGSGATYTWVVDPLDGTKAFAKGIPGFSVMIGLLREGEPYLGVVADPLEGHLYEAVRGEGCIHTLKGKRQAVHVSSRKDIAQMPVVISTGFPEAKLQKAQEAMKFPLVAPINSVGIKVGLLVRQIGDIYLNHHGVSYWDTCGPQIILEEAGGVMTLLDGSPLVYDIEKKREHPLPTLATNGTRHQEILDWCERLNIP